MLKVSKGSSGPDSRRGLACASFDDGAGLGMLASTIGRATELCGRLEDARALARKLAEMRDGLRFDLARAECEAATAARLGRDFSARRSRAAAEGFREEIEDTEAMIVEVDGVLRRLRRERRVLQQRLATSYDLAAALPQGPERLRLTALLAEAHASLDRTRALDEPAAQAAQEAATGGAIYTFTRGETKQTGQAR